MIVTRVGAVYTLELPMEINHLLSYFTITISIGLTSSQDMLTCMGLNGYLNRLRFWMCASHSINPWFPYACFTVTCVWTSVSGTHRPS